MKGLQDAPCTENIVEQGEITHFEQFHLFPQCFPKVFFFSVLNWVYMDEKVKSQDVTWQILDSSKLKEFADDNFKFDENGRKLSKRVENTVGKGEIARYEQFLLFPQCFQKACFPEASKGVIVWEWVNQMTKYWLTLHNLSCFATWVFFLHSLLHNDTFWRSTYL